MGACEADKDEMLRPRPRFCGSIDAVRYTSRSSRRNMKAAAEVASGSKEPK